jgi:hypothetical protein
MSPSILQLQSTGLQDVYLTQNLQINIFKYSYYKYVNFATETTSLTLNESPAFNRRFTCDIPKRGHLLSKLYLSIQLSPIAKRSGTYACWTDSIGYAIFSEPIELEIGGVVVDRIYPQFMDMWDEFTNGTKQMGKNLMLGKSDIITSAETNAIKPLNLIIPLDFWFTKQYSSALPILSMHSQDIRIHFKLKDFAQLVNYDGDEPEPATVVNAKVLAEYIYLDDIILQQFRKQKHMYVIEQVQFNVTDYIPPNTAIYNSALKFNHPVKEIVFAFAKRDNIEINNYFVYQNDDETPLITSANLIMDGKKKWEDYLEEIVFRTIFPDSVHSVIPIKYVYCIPFALRPEDNQPTGSINMSRFNDVALSVKLPHNSPEMYMYTYALNYNIITIENGSFTLEFSS